MRSIKFRGRHIKSGKWLFGSLLNNAFQVSKTGEFVTCIFDPDSLEYEYEYDCDEEVGAIFGENEVDPKTVGQFTGLKDKNGTEIYEGDVIKVVDGSINGVNWARANMEVKILNGAVNLPLWVRQEDWDSTHYIEVIGNIHENPELLGDNK